MRRLVMARALVLARAALAQAQGAFSAVNNPFARPESARFKLISEDGVVTPDSHMFIRDAKVWTIADKASGICYLLVFTPGGTTAISQSACERMQ